MSDSRSNLKLVLKSTYDRLFAVAVEELGENAKSRTQHIVAFLVDIPDVLFNERAIQRMQHALNWRGYVDVVCIRLIIHRVRCLSFGPFMYR